MPALPDVPGVLKLELQHTYIADLDVLVRQYWQYTGTAPTVANLTAFCTSVGDVVNTDLKSLFNGDVELVLVKAIDLTSPTSAESEVATSVTGTRSGTILPASAAMVVGQEFNRRYRGGHSRGYWPFGVEADLLTPQEWTTGFLGSVQTGINAYVAGVASAGWAGAGSLDQVNVSYFEGFTAVENPLTHRYRNVPNVRPVPLVDLITTWVPRPRVGSQRRRLGKA